MAIKKQIFCGIGITLMKKLEQVFKELQLDVMDEREKCFLLNCFMQFSHGILKRRYF